MPTRRDVLAGCGVAAGAAALPGCSALSAFGGPPAYVDYLPAGQSGPTRLGSLRMASLAERDLPADLLREHAAGVAAERVERYLTVEVEGRVATVLETSLDDAELRDRVESETIGTLQARDAYGGYDRYDVAESRYLVAIADGTAVVAEREPMEAVLDTERGERERLYEADEDVAELVDRLGDGDRVELRARLDADDGALFEPGEACNGDRSDVGPETTEQHHVAVFGSADDADEEAVRRRLDRAAVEDLEVERDGRVVTATYTIPTSQL